MNWKIKFIIYLVVLIIIVFGAITIFLGIKYTQEYGKIIEVSQENFEKEVLNSNKKVLVDFYATWCEPCKMLEASIQEIVSENRKIKIVKIDVEKCKELVNKYNIKAMPTLIVIEKGNEKNRSVGVISKDKILELCGIN